MVNNIILLYFCDMGEQSLKETQLKYTFTEDGIYLYLAQLGELFA